MTLNGVGLASSTIGRNFTALVSGTNSGNNAQLLAPTAMCNMTRIDVSGPTTIEVICNDPISLALKDASFRAILVGDNSVGSTGGGAAFSLHNTFSSSTYTPLSAFSWNSGGGAMTVTHGFGAPDFNSLQARHSMSLSFPSQHALTSAITNNPGESCEIQSQGLASQFTDVVCYNRTGPVNTVHTALKLSSGRPGQNGGLAFIDAGTGGWSACSHFVVSLNPVTIDVSCFNSAGAFANTGSALTVLVLQ